MLFEPPIQPILQTRSITYNFAYNILQLSTFNPHFPTFLWIFLLKKLHEGDRQGGEELELTWHFLPGKFNGHGSLFWKHLTALLPVRYHKGNSHLQVKPTRSPIAFGRELMCIFTSASLAVFKVLDAPAPMALMACAGGFKRAECCRRDVWVGF